MNAQTEGTAAGGARWYTVAPPAAPVTVTAGAAPQQVTGLPIRGAAFASPAAGWVVVGTDADHHVLYTDDAGATWRSQLAWRGSLYGFLRAFDERQALVVLGLWPHRPEVNGRPVGLAENHAMFAGTDDAGATWTLGYPPDRMGVTFDALSPRLIWQQLHVGSYPHDRFDLVRTADGGANWQRLDRPEGIVQIQVAFETVDEGLLITADRHRADRPYVTGDGGITWTPLALRTPLGVPAGAETWLNPVLRPAPGLLWLTAYPRREGPMPPWSGAYLYRRAGAGLDAWSGPYRLPRPADEPWLGVAVPGTDGRIWAGSRRELWVSEPAGGWRPVTLPDGQSIASLNAVGNGVLWLSTTEEPLPGNTFSGRLYRSSDDGGTWTEVTVGSAPERPDLLQ
jgi:hypothetical protein